MIYYPLSFALPWTEAGILDAEAAQEVLDDLGADTFAPGPVSMAAAILTGPGANVSAPRSSSTSCAASASKIPASVQGSANESG